jgi:O-phosphoseryl-tRNA(Cys) synthetase
MVEIEAYLDVSFQQVVHPVLREEAGVAKQQHSLGGPDEHP